jgi:hypothetical protein
VAGRVSERCCLVLRVWYEGSCFTGFCKVICGYGVWQAGLGGSLLPGSVLGLANVCTKHVELILEINKTVTVASRSWCSILLYLHSYVHDIILYVFVAPYLISITQTVNCVVGRSKDLEFALNVSFSDFSRDLCMSVVQHVLVCSMSVGFALTEYVFLGAL